jgi:hypothetical protein
MGTYRIYTKGSDGHLKGPPREVDCIHDQEALERAGALKDDADLEVWQGSRLVAVLTGTSQGRAT